MKAEPSVIHSHTEYGNEKLSYHLFISRSQSPTGNATERLCLHNLVSMKAEPSVIHSHTEYGNEKLSYHLFIVNDEE